MVPAMSSGSNPSCILGEKVKLRVSYGGEFIKDPDSGKWSYKGGKNHVDTLPVSFRYGDVAFRWTEKVKGDLTELKYQLPGEELDREALITVSDDNDLQEMFDEYFRGLKMASPTGKTFHLRVFLFFDMIQEPLTPAEYADGFDFFRTSSGVERTRKEAVAHAEWDASSFGSNASMESAGTNSHRLKHGHAANEQAAIAAAQVMTLHWEENMLGNLQRASRYPWGVDAAPEALACYPHPGLDDSAFLESFQPPSSPSTAATGTSEPGPAAAQPLHYLFKTQSWYVKGGDMPVDTAGALVTLAPSHGMKAGPAGSDLLPPLHSAPGTPAGAHRKPAGGVLPSHISIFGDGPDDAGNDGDPSACGDEGASVKLPSHISAFGDGDQEEPLYAARLLGEPQPFAVFPGVYQPNELPSPAMMSMEVARRGSTPLEHAHSGSALGTGAKGAQHNVHRVPKEEVKVLGRIGEGAFGEVSLATCAIFGKVAVKWLKPGKVQAHSASFWREADMLASLNHPNVLRFYGAVVASSDDPAVVGIMTEYMRGGSLSHFLTSQSAVIPLRTRAELALHAVNGLAYLHEMNVVHFDLKPDNLLLDGPLLLAPGYAVPALKVADFGLSKHKWNSYVSGVRDLRGTLPYMAPELVSDPDHVSEKADVWSLGMVLWEMLAQRTPFQHLAPQQIIAGLMVGNLAPEVPQWCEPEWRGLMEACWEVNPVCRPAFRDLATQLEKIIEAAPLPGAGLL